MDNNKNIFGVIVFIIILSTFIFGGYFAMRYFTHHPTKSKSGGSEETIDLRIDKTKDHLYYDSSEDILKSEEIHKEKVVFNFAELSELNATLEKETNEVFNSIKYTKDMELPTTDTEGNTINYLENEEGIYSLNYRDFEDTKFNNYLSLVVKDYSYDIIKGATPLALKGYVVDITTGKIISEEDLFARFNVNKDTIKEKVRERLNATQILEEDAGVKLDIEGTVNDLSTYALSVNKVGKLTVTFIVKSNQNNYNDSVELN